MPSTAVGNMSGVSRGMSVSMVSAVQADPSQPTLCVETLPWGNLFIKACVVGEQQFDVPCRSPNKWDSHIASIYEFESEIWNGRRHGHCADGSLVVHPVTPESIPGRTLVVVLAPEWQQNQTVSALIDEGSLLDSSGNFLAGLGNRDSTPRMVLMVIVRSALLLKGVVGSTERGKMLRIIDLSLELSIPFGQRGRAHPPIWYTGAKEPSLWTKAPFGTWQGVELVLRCGPCPPRCTDSDTRTQPFTMPMLTEKNRTMSGWRKRISVSVLIMVCGHVWEIRRIQRKPRSGHVKGFLT